MTKENLLKKIVNTRNWYAKMPEGKRIRRQRAYAIKKQVLDGTISDWAIIDTLKRLGFNEVQKSQWK